MERASERPLDECPWSVVQACMMNHGVASCPHRHPRVRRSSPLFGRGRAPAAGGYTLTRGMAGCTCQSACCGALHPSAEGGPSHCGKLYAQAARRCAGAPPSQLLCRCPAHQASGPPPPVGSPPFRIIWHRRVAADAVRDVPSHPSPAAALAGRLLSQTSQCRCVCSFSWWGCSCGMSEGSIGHLRELPHGQSGQRFPLLRPPCAF